MSRSIPIYIDAEDVLDGISTRVLEAELESRQDREIIPISIETRNVEIAEAVKGGDLSHIRIVLDRYLPGIGELI